MKRYIQLSAGRGPVECARAVALVAKELLKYFLDAELVKVKRHNTEPDCYMSMLFLAESSESKEREWAGTVLWRATSNRYLPNHRRRNWFVGVSFINPLELPKISEKDITYETMRAEGHGGQNVNKVETAVRAIHLPFGLSVKCGTQRSQAQNREMACRLLLIKLQQSQNSDMAAFRASNWSNHDALQRGNPSKTFAGEI